MTNGSFASMTEREQRDLARHLAEGSEIFDFEKALEFVRFDPVEAKQMVRDRERGKQLLEELARANRRLHLSAREFR